MRRRAVRCGLDMRELEASCTLHDANVPAGVCRACGSGTVGVRQRQRRRRRRRVSKACFLRRSRSALHPEERLHAAKLSLSTRLVRHGLLDRRRRIPACCPAFMQQRCNAEAPEACRRHPSPSHASSRPEPRNAASSARNSRSQNFPPRREEQQTFKLSAPPSAASSAGSRRKACTCACQPSQLRSLRLTAGSTTTRLMAASDGECDHVPGGPGRRACGCCS
ncbi:hypothetical protein FA09DRAFT_186300 [Tilletiopsis washingtonensis]|uniref:Uncharacterized protein n=1 Tax=Tilletiopsis washingtonensis TaxID=58919 RepID=A0A316ZFB8_9BASI|nr:hypothetical protein FA09DRAFT_186300 [Tilletiopsis washingtonensis]PWO00441.1 hypothetical protein FA09DRAFT_186300 [Tilletiopsis washingtonensis]